MLIDFLQIRRPGASFLEVEAPAPHNRDVDFAKLWLRRVCKPLAVCRMLRIRTSPPRLDLGLCLVTVATGLWRRT